MLFDDVDQLLANLNLNVCESVDVSPRSETRVATPGLIVEGRSRTALKGVIPDGQIWKHQALALDHLCAGRNMVISTGTASGKSLIFQLYALHRLFTEPDSKILALYPLRALANDQWNSWRRVANSAGLYDQVGRIDGSVRPISKRPGILENSRIVLMTPDVCQAWLLRTLGSPETNRFIGSLALLVLDEAHAYESVFGSNAAFLLRRLLAAKRQLSPGGRNSRQLQIIAATATINNPADHLNNLTGLDFSVVDESENSAPRSPRRILHVEGPEQGRDGEDAMAQFLAGICAMPERRRFISFADSRQGIERIVRDLNLEEVNPYRSGYEESDRSTIERSLRNGTLHGVVSTSALELGIDIADMDIGVNLGVPQSRKSFRQRLGRIGRTSPGVFVVMAPANAFTKFGESLSQYYESSVEPSYLYLGNRFVQFAHARCLRDEADSLSRNSTEILRGVNWPEGFSGVLGNAREGYSREFDAMAQIGGDSPHFNYPLRQLGDTNVEIQQGSGDFAQGIGNMSYQQAIREAYPGATYLHLGKAYKVNGWNSGFNKIVIHVANVPNAAPTRPVLRTSVTVDLSREGTIPGRLKNSSSGLLAEAQVQVNESVEGYSIGNTQNSYKDLQATNPRMRRKQRNFRTTGVIVQIEDDWFANPSVRREVADGLRDLLARDRSIAPQDIDSVSTNISLISGGASPARVTNAVVIYDSVYGGLRLTENLFDEFNQYVELLVTGAGLSRGNGIVSIETAESLAEWAEGLSDFDGLIHASALVEPPSDGNWMQVFKPGSLVGVFIAGNVVDREIVGLEYRDFFNSGSPVLYYSYYDPRNNGTSYTPGDGIQPIGHDWEWVWWNPDTGEYLELEPSE